ncbi:sialoadhesin-like [Triplophysa dalaica]|uniref:sialoadhesin-like n=1 Tax=Triplophysa dalaica TaxID=1582913 RepID=UPI0024E03F6A|nr:sialoadhesin-like [Triplophysa dalaica]XP_056612844.1 sialoadhesin-like [Triplophysa dalaica]
MSKHCDPGMKVKLLLRLIFQGFLLYETLAWEVRVPKEIHGLKGSCLVIPCSFSYTSYPPTNPNRVVWYQWVSKGYPLVYHHEYPSYVIDKFKGKTALYGKPSNRDCSLVITHLDQSHHGEKLYAWIDPDSIGWRTYKFYDVTSTILVDESPQKPTINVHGGAMTGDTITVTCETYHTCPYSKPNIILKGIEGSDKTDQTDHPYIGNGQWKITLTRTGVVKAEHLDIECIVTHYGGITTRATKSQSAKCNYTKIAIEPDRADVIEGVAKKFTCTIDHSCLKNPPTISWNYKNMEVSNSNKKLSELKSATSSTITFVSTKEDHDKMLNCSANISGKNIESSLTLHVQHSSTEPPKPAKPVQNPTLFQGEAEVMTFDWKTTGLYIIVPSSVILLLMCTLAGVCTYKRRHRPPPDDVQEQRSKDVYSESAKKTFSKPHMPSPKSQRKSCSIEDYEDYYTNIEDLNTYGNI